LRILTVIAAMCLMPYFYFQSVPIMTPIYWNVGFTILNVFWIVLLLLERRPIRLSAEEEQLCELVFRTMTPREMMRILRIATWKTADIDECFIDRGSKLDELIVIYSGKACVKAHGEAVAEILPGQFIGSISYITEETAPADIVALEATCYARSTSRSTRTSRAFTAATGEAPWSSKRPKAACRSFRSGTMMISTGWRRISSAMRWQSSASTRR
jgi:hypothetical protein